jgi:hypothetical protein
VDDELVSLFAGGGRLRSLDLRNCNNVHGPSLRELAACLNLRRLGLGWCFELSRQAFDHIDELVALEILDLGRTEIGRSALLGVGRAACLTELDLSGCHQINDQSLEHLSPLKTLRWLNLCDCESVTEGAVGSLRQKLPNCVCVRTKSELDTWRW